MATLYVQRGEFNTETEAYRKDETTFGMYMKLTFIDHFPVPDALVALIQAIKCTKGTTLATLNEPYPSGGLGVQDPQLLTAAKWKIDAEGEKRKCPAFGMEFGEASTDWTRWLGAKSRSKDRGSDGQLGRVEMGPLPATVQWSGGTPPARVPLWTEAMLRDGPTRTWNKGPAFHHQFEVVAVCVCKDKSAAAHGTVRGVVTWGYKYSEAGAFTEDQPVAGNRPSQTWVEAAQAWNWARNNTIPGKPDKWLA